MATIMLEKSAKEIENIFCIGRNYAKHIEELNNATPTEPLVFLKPTSALSSCDSAIELPAFSDDIHYETEIVLYIGQSARNIAPEDALALIEGYGVGLDLTARDTQSMIKTKGEPWTKCKGFPSAAIVSPFVSADKITDPKNIHFTFTQNGVLKQTGNSGLMLYSITEIISYLSNTYGLTEGDLIFTGTPEGVGKLKSGDQLQMTLEQLIDVSCKIS